MSSQLLAPNLVLGLDSSLHAGQIPWSAMLSTELTSQFPPEGHVER